MNKTLPTFFSIAAILLLLLFSLPCAVYAAAEAGSTVRNAFGPQAGPNANRCRGACGSGCASTCSQSVTFECSGDRGLQRVVNYDCGTHQACRAHDDCLDTCLRNGSSGDCQAQCDARVTEQYGIQNSFSWLRGNGPYDGRISFEYTRDAPDALEPAYTCPAGSSRQCGDSGGCVNADGQRVDPVFASYPAAAGNTMRVSAFRSGPLCGDGVCAHANDIRVTGGDNCAGGRCTRFGMEFDYQNADPSAPLECSTSTTGGEGDFIGDLLKQGGDAMTSRNPDAANQTEDGMAALMGMFGQVLASADSPEDIDVTITPHGADGKPDPSRAVGSGTGDTVPPIPRRVDLPATSGHLFVPMYQMADGLKVGEVKERRVTCTHKGAPVLETVFRLQGG